MNERICVIAGKEDTLVSAECGRVLEQLLEPEQRATGLFSVDGDEASVSEVLDELRTAPFLTEKRVVLVKGADDFISQNRQLLEKYFDNPCSTGILILAVSSWPKQTKLAKKLVKVGRLISLTAPKPWQLPGRLVKYTSDAYDKKLTTEAAELLVELTGDELTRLYSEIDKLVLFADAEKVINECHVELLIGHNRIFGAFAVIDAIIVGEAGQAIERLRNMFAQDRTAEYTVVGAFAFHLRRMFKAKALLGKGVRSSEVVNRLRIWSKKEKFFLQLRKMSLEEIGANIQRLAAIDYAIKTGQTKARIAMEQFVLSLAGSSAG